MSNSIPTYPTHVVKMRDCWDGECDIVYVFAFEKDDILFHHDDATKHGKPILQYEGDEILELWPLELACHRANKPDMFNPLFWYRPHSNGEMCDGPIHDSAIEQVRKDSGLWIPLYDHPANQPSAEDLLVRALAALVYHTQQTRQITESENVIASLMKYLANQCATQEEDPENPSIIEQPAAEVGIPAPVTEPLTRGKALVWLIENFKKWPTINLSLPEPDGWVWGTHRPGDLWLQEKNGFGALYKYDWQGDIVYLPKNYGSRLEKQAGIIKKASELTADGYYWYRVKPSRQWEILHITTPQRLSYGIASFEFLGPIPAPAE